METLYTWDLGIYRFINTHLTAAWLDPAVSLLSSTLFWAVVMAIALGVATALRKTRALKILAAIGVAIAVTDATTTYVLKPNFNRVRPCHYLEGARRVGNICGSREGMPSNHAANGMAAAVLLGIFASQSWFWLALFFVLIVGFTRIYLGVHYPTDILVGYLFGASFGAIVALFFRPLMGRKK